MSLVNTLQLVVKHGPYNGLKLRNLAKRFPQSTIDSPYVHPYAKLNEGVQISHDVRIGQDVTFGRYSYVMPYSIILNADIGHFCSIGSYTSIGGWQHPYKMVSTSPKLYRDVLGVEYNDVGKKVVIGDDVWVGDGAIILSGIVSDGAVIAAGAVVTKDIPPYEIWGGVPAQRIGQRFSDDVRDSIMSLHWTKWSDDEIKLNAKTFLEVPIME